MSKTLRDHIAPMNRHPNNMPEAWKRLAIRLSFAVGPESTAYVFGVHPDTIRNWRDSIRL
jgi:hypothetical protein